MKKSMFGFLSICIILSILFGVTSCSVNHGDTQEYLYEYKNGQKPCIKDTSQTGTFFILEKEIAKEYSDGRIVLKNLYANGEYLNVCIEIESTDEEEILKKEREEAERFFPEIKVKNSKLKLCSYGLSRAKIPTEEDGRSIFTVLCSYKYKHPKDKKQIQLDFYGKIFDVQLKEVSAYSESSVEGRELNEKYFSVHANE